MYPTVFWLSSNELTAGEKDRTYRKRCRFYVVPSDNLTAVNVPALRWKRYNFLGKRIINSDNSDDESQPSHGNKPVESGRDK